MKKIWWLIVIVFAALFLFVGEISSEEKEIRKNEIEELVKSQTNLLQTLFDQNQRESQILGRILCVAQENENQVCEELEKMRKMVKMANKDLLKAIKLINGLHGKDKIEMKDLEEIQEKLEWASLVHGAVNNFLRTIFGLPQPPQSVKRPLKRDIIVSLPPAHFFEVGIFLKKLAPVNR